MALSLWWHGTSGQGIQGVEDAPGVIGEKKERRRGEENKGKERREDRVVENRGEET